MVVPSRWFAGGKGLDEFRESMLKDDRIRVVQDFVDSSEIFPGTQIKGGVMYFVWDRDNPGKANITTHIKGLKSSKSERKLLEPGLDIFVRYEIGLRILRKIIKVENPSRISNNAFLLPDEKQFQNLVSARKPFGLPTDFRGKSSKSKNNLKCYQLGGISYVPESQIQSGKNLVNKHKVFVAYAGSGDQYPNPVISKPFLGLEGEICTETYLSIGPFESKTESLNVANYMASKFFRFLLILRKPSQHVTKNVYAFIPTQDFSKIITDEILYKKYQLTSDEIDFIEKMVRPMELNFE
jgi:site-specific DNA-methyltransferase (adenine-specific)